MFIKEHRFNMADTIRFGLEQLKMYRFTTRNVAELEWEIRLYQFILNQKDPDEAAARFLKTRHGLGGYYS